jgi:hypothetical protein
MARPPPPPDAPRPSLAEIAAGAPASVQRRRQRRARPRSRLFRWIVALLALGMAGGVVVLGAAAWFLLDLNRTPREFAPYVERRASGNHGLIVMAGDLIARFLLRMDRLPREGEPAIPPAIGASAARSGAPPQTMARLVTNTQQLAAALASAEPGQVIQLVPGTYRLEGRGLLLNRPGAPGAPIVLRAERLGDATIDANVVAAFKAMAPHWVVENLVIRGVCGGHSDCEHALHVVGAATNMVIRNNRMEDFNAHIKINGEDGLFPDQGRIEGNTMVNGAPRNTRNPVTPIDLVTASQWRITGNFIADFQRQGAGAATYGAFMKGAGEGTVMARNVVLCEWRLRRRSYSPNVGLSIGGGGTWPDAIKRDLGRSGIEQDRGVIRDNLIAFCNDVGIYVNKGQRSLVTHNTLLDTAGIGVRFGESTADVVANIIDGVVQARDGGTIRLRANEMAPLLGLFAGWHPARDFYRDPARLDLRWRSRPETVMSGEVGLDLCGTERSGRVMPGAFEDFARCR